MERQFRLNWPFLVEEATARRKAQRLTQQRLALLAGVSTPTISRFENGEKDLQLSSVMNILSVVGMMDQRTLEFSHPRAVSDFDRNIVRFTGTDGEKKVPCAISTDALEDHFGGPANQPLKIFSAHRAQIEREARRLYILGRLEPDGSVLIRTTDLMPGR